MAKPVESVDQLCGSTAAGTLRKPFLFESANCQFACDTKGLTNESCARAAVDYCLNPQNVDIVTGTTETPNRNVSLFNYPIFYSDTCKQRIKQLIYEAPPKISEIVHSALTQICSAPDNDRQIPFTSFLNLESYAETNFVQAATASSAPNAVSLTAPIQPGNFKAWGTPSCTGDDTLNKISVLRVNPGYKNVALVNIACGGLQDGSFDYTTCADCSPASGKVSVPPNEKQFPAFADRPSFEELKTLKTRDVYQSAFFVGDTDSKGNTIQVPIPYTTASTVWLRDDSDATAPNGVKYTDILRAIQDGSSCGDGNCLNDILMFRTETQAKTVSEFYGSVSSVTFEASQATIDARSESDPAGIITIKLSNVFVTDSQVYISVVKPDNVLLTGQGATEDNPQIKGTDLRERVSWNEIPDPIAQSPLSSIVPIFSMYVFWDLSRSMLRNEIVKTKTAKVLKFQDTIADNGDLNGSQLLGASSIENFTKSMCACHLGKNITGYYKSVLADIEKTFSSLENFAQTPECYAPGCAASDFPSEAMLTRPKSGPAVLNCKVPDCLQNVDIGKITIGGNLNIKLDCKNAKVTKSSSSSSTKTSVDSSSTVPGIHEQMTSMKTLHRDEKLGLGILLSGLMVIVIMVILIIVVLIRKK